MHVEASRACAIMIWDEQGLLFVKTERWQQQGAWCQFFFHLFFFFSSRRRHTRCSRDWSSDVCSSDLSSPSVQTVPSGPGSPPFWPPVSPVAPSPPASYAQCDALLAANKKNVTCPANIGDRKSVVKGKSEDLGGGGIIKKKKDTGSVAP